MLIPPPREGPESATAAPEQDTSGISAGVGKNSPGEVPPPRRRGRRPYFPCEPDLEIAQILSWADAHHERTGKWPTVGSGLIPEWSGERWRTIDQALRQGYRGLEGGSSLARLLALHRNRRNVKALPPFYEAQILAWADAYRERTGEWPKHNSGSIPESPGDQWTHVHSALREGHRGLPEGSSLARLLACRRGRPIGRACPALRESRVLKWAHAHRARTGRWPRGDDGPIPEAPGETWTAVDEALRHGTRGLRGGSSLGTLLAAHGGVHDPFDVPPLTVEQILALADAFHTRTGDWPTGASGPIPEAPGETWMAIDAALRMGRRGLSGGTSVARLLAERHGRAQRAAGLRRSVQTQASDPASAARRETGPPAGVSVPSGPVDSVGRLSPHLGAMRPRSLPGGGAG